MDSGSEDNFLNNCHQHCNVKLVCKDGDISSHKLIISRNSEFLKKLLWNIPVGDSVTLYLPDFLFSYIKKSLCSLQSDKTFDREIGTAENEAENTLIQPKVKIEEYEDDLKYEADYDSDHDEDKIEEADQIVSKVASKQNISKREFSSSASQHWRMLQTSKLSAQSLEEKMKIREEMKKLFDIAADEVNRQVYDTVKVIFLNIEVIY